MVIRQHVGMQVGRKFDTDAAAARFYFREGWRLGIVPNPLIDAPAARFSLASALLLRNSLAAATLNASIPFSYSASRYAPRNGESPVSLTRFAADAPDKATIRIAGTSMTWARYLTLCEELGDTVRRTVEFGLFDVDFYQDQIGGARVLSAYAAVDDYIANGELDGRTPHPFFEAEWYRTHEKSLLQRDRPVNYFLDFIRRGEESQASPHFSGHKYLSSLDSERPPSPLAHFARSAPADSVTPSCDGVRPVTRGVAETTVRARVGEYHAQQALLKAEGAPLSRHRRVGATQATSTGSCVVFVDERHLSSRGAATALREVLGQTLKDLRVVVVEQDDVPRLPEVEALLDEFPQVDSAARMTVDESFGAVIHRHVLDASPTGWTVWTPAQRWSEDYLAIATGALVQDSEAAAFAVVAGTLPQPWLRTTDATWVDVHDGSGVVFAGSKGWGSRIPLDLDMGVAWRMLLEIVDDGARCLFVEAPLVLEVATEDVGPLDARAGANVARRSRLAPFSDDPRPGVAVVIPTFDDWVLTRAAVDRVLQSTEDNVVVQIIDNGSRRPVSTVLASVFAAEDRVTVRRLPLNTDFALGSNVGASDAARDTIVFLNNDTAVQDGWLDPLLNVLREDDNVAAQPLLLYGDRTVQTAGTVFLGAMAMPKHLLADVHPLDVDPRLEAYEFSALTAACIALRYDDVRALRGFDAHYVNGMEDVDLCMKLKERGKLRVCTTSRVIHYESRTPGRHVHHFANRARFARRWRSALVNDLDDRDILEGGDVFIEDVRWKLPPGSPMWEADVIYAQRPVIDVNESSPRLRWAIKTAATGDVWGDSWGDTFFAESLAAALRRLGQDVVIDRRTAHDRPSSASWDDVTLTLRGLERYLPQPGAINLLWVISHPDLVTRYELESGFQRVYAAGDVWAEQVKSHWGIDVTTLLQATDISKFHPDAGGDARKEGVTFVGRTRGVPRQIVADAIAAGARPRIFGDDGWEQFVDPSLVVAKVLHNDDVPAEYASAQIVLNDHWRDMASFGFLSNRLFDAAAAGARIISDEAAGLNAVFGQQVQTYSSINELRGLLDANSSRWPSDLEIKASAHDIRREHSFDARARVLLSDVIAIRNHEGA
ncbi:glycosyltransferase [Microbacterium aurantiacum]|uniref:glycosyltransferase n=1 Tax=Microbacterium aurantiacum TaxID=162393 RepID=UPI001F4476DA|nr:glycosyltransferase [Microbacterium aurantiacum]